MESRKNDKKENKLRWELLPLNLIEKIVEVYHFGASKYAPNTWQELPDGYERYKAAFFRHLTAYEKVKHTIRKADCTIWLTWHGTR